MAYTNGNGAGDAVVEQDSIDKRKAFVGGLSPETTEDDLKTYFAQFGPVQHAVVKLDQVTGRSRCFAFVTFADATGLKKIATVPIHILKGKKIDPKPAEPRPGQEVGVNTKIFVGGVDTAMDETEVTAYFEKFGKVKSLQWPKDRLRDNAKKNFVFIEFEDGKVVDELVKTPKQQIGGRMCDVRIAVPPAAKVAAYADPYAAGYGYQGYQGYAAPYDPYAVPAYDPYTAAPAYDPYNAAPAYDPYAAAPAYDPYGPAYPGYAPRPRGAPMGRGGAARPPYAPRGYHPYRRV